MLAIPVKQKHIKKGQVSDTQCCPIALALKEKFKTRLVVVGGEYALIKGVRYNLRRGANFIKRFDSGLMVKPFTAILRKSVDQRDSNYLL